jgi:hypothetical protein
LFEVEKVKNVSCARAYDDVVDQIECELQRQQLQQS